MKKLLVVLVCLSMVVGILGIAGCGSTTVTAYTLDDSSKLTPTQNANLRTIEGAATAYWGMKNAYPTNINQLVPNYMMRMPIDEKKGVYSLKTVNGKPVAVVKF